MFQMVLYNNRLQFVVELLMLAKNENSIEIGG